MLKIRIATFVMALALSSLTVVAQDQITTSPADDQAAAQASFFASANRALTDAGRSSRESDRRISASPASNRGHGGGNGPALFPADLGQFSPTGAVVTTATQHNIYINQPPSAWGNPAGFIADLNKSDFIHISDQYLGVDFTNRYPLGASFGAIVTPGAAFPGKPANIITQAQIISLVHAAASRVGTGYNHIFNVFIPPGVDTCFPGNRVCFAPDSPNNFFFCAYHGSGTFPDIGHVVFTVEPETGVIGCQSAQPSPNGVVADSVDSTLSHELFELVTDPDGDAWFVLGSLDLFGFEIGDVCQDAGNDKGEFLNPPFRVNGHLYAIQKEYDNHGHGCFTRPVED
jgi:hypothetical protein